MEKEEKLILGNLFAKISLKLCEIWWTRVDYFSRLNLPEKASSKQFYIKILKNRSIETDICIILVVIQIIHKNRVSVFLRGCILKPACRLLLRFPYLVLHEEEL